MKQLVRNFSISRFMYPSTKVNMHHILHFKKHYFGRVLVNQNFDKHLNISKTVYSFKIVK